MEIQDSFMRNQQPRSILFLSDSDISVDSRILKAISVVPSSIRIFAVGITRRSTTSIEKIPNVICKQIRPRSRGLTFLPSYVRHLFTLLEFYIRGFLHITQIQPSFIHCNDFIALPLACLAKLFFRSRVIYDAHELESNRNGISPTSGRVIFLIEKILWRYIDGFITVSQSIRSWYFSRFEFKPSVLVYNSPSFTKPPTKSIYLRARFDIPADALIFIYVGYLMPGRSLETITKIFASLPPTHHLVLLGEGSLLASLESISSNSPNIHFHPFVKHSDVVPILSSADVGLCFIENVSLSDYLSLPNKLFEYSFAGLRILACDFPEIASYISKHSLGSTSPADYTSLSAAILNYTSLSFEPTDLSHFSWPNQAKILYNFYNAVFFE